MNIVINRCWGGYGLSEKAQEDLNTTDPYLYSNDRTNSDLIRVIKNLGDDANGECAKLEIIDIPNYCYYVVDDYDGMERVFYSDSEIGIKA